MNYIRIKLEKTLFNNVTFNITLRYNHDFHNNIKPMSNDWLVTVEFEECGQKKMLTSFIKLNIL